MTDQFVPAAPEERRPLEAQAVPAGPGPNDGLDDPRALTILTTEHWGLLTARSLVYNEAFARAGMFLAFLSATLVVLGLISAVAGLGDPLLVIAAAILALDLFIGLASVGRISAASYEDLRYLQGMNRLRHAYLEMAPALERYMITSGYDDFASVSAFYGPRTGTASTFRGLVHGLTTATGMISVICAAVAGALVAVLAFLVTHDPVVGVVAGLAGFVAMFVTLSVVIISGATTFARTMPVLFPPPGGSGEKA